MTPKNPVNFVRSSLSPSRSPTPITRPGTSGSRLSKEQIDQIIDSPFNTGYTYSCSNSYTHGFNNSYTIPQLCRDENYGFSYRSFTMVSNLVVTKSTQISRLCIDKILQIFHSFPDLLLTSIALFFTSMQYSSLVLLYILSRPFVFIYKASLMLIKGIWFIIRSFVEAFNYFLKELFASIVSSSGCLTNLVASTSRHITYQISLFFRSILDVFSSVKNSVSFLISSQGQNVNRDPPTKKISKSTRKAIDRTQERDTISWFYPVIFVSLLCLLLYGGFYWLNKFQPFGGECKKCDCNAQACTFDINDPQLHDKILNVLKEQSITREVQHVIEKDKHNDAPDYEIIFERVDRMINEQFRRYDADRTGMADYALESSGGSVISTRCTVQYEEKSRTEKIFGIPLWFSSYSPRSVIQRKGYGTSAGECWAFVGPHGYLTMQLSRRINVTAISYEHLPIELSPEGHIRTAPKNFLIWSFQDLNTKSQLLGNFTYDSNGEPLQMFPVQQVDPLFTPIIELETLSNHGANVTCLYRLRVHGTHGPEEHVELPQHDEV